MTDPFRNDGRQFAKALAELVRDVETLKRSQRSPQLPHSTVHTGRILHRDSEGKLRKVDGRLNDGTVGVQYGNGPSPPRPAGITVGARQLALVVGWDGTFEGGVPRPGDLARADVHMGETAGFTHDGTTVIASLYTEGAVSFFADSDTKYIKVVAVTTSDVASAPTDEIEILPLPADQLAVGSVGADQLVADLILASIIRMQNAAGEDTVVLDGNTGNVLATGQFATAVDGARIVVNPVIDPGNYDPQAIFFYPNLGDEYKSRLQGYDSDLNGFSGLRLNAGRDESVSYQTGYCSLSEEGGARIYWGNPTMTDPGDPNTVIAEEDKNAEFIAWDGGIYVFSKSTATNSAAVYNNYVDATMPIPSGYSRRSFNFQMLDGGGNIIQNARLEYWAQGVNQRAFLSSPVSNSGLVFGANSLYATDWDGDAGPIGATAFNNTSGRDSKRDVRDLPFSALDAVMAAPVSEWEYVSDTRDEQEVEVPSGEIDDRGRPVGPPHKVTLPAREAPRHIFPMAEDLPESMVSVDPDRPDEKQVDLRDALGVLWAAVQELSDRLPQR
ncbi:MAG: hypothetical protein GEV09_15575 [Pseudonocardiaceae bacterium]|nr:hypothetical protein [Pseudonocardiaceae bacterium]